MEYRSSRIEQPLETRVSHGRGDYNIKPDLKTSMTQN